MWLGLNYAFRFHSEENILHKHSTQVKQSMYGFGGGLEIGVSFLAFLFSGLFLKPY